ncbi:MAG TPA: LysR substrate-binding domain-containing protein [Mycobacteriales bacterium]
MPLATDSYIKPPCSIDQIRTFLAVASREHVTDAAKALRLSQPAVTQQIHQLERALDLRLFQRVGRNIQLTDEGLEVAAACLLVMRSLENLEQVARSVRGLEQGSLTIGATQVTGNYYLSGTLAAFAARHPDISLDVVMANTEEVCMHVASGQLDCGLVDAPLPELSLQHTAVAKDEVVLVAHPDHPLQDVAEIRRGDLRGMKYLVWEPGSATEMVGAELLGAGYDDVSRLLMTSLEAVRRALVEGLGFASVPRIAVDAELRSGALARLPVPARTRAICAVRRPTPAGSTVEAFWPALASSASALAGRPRAVDDRPERSAG